MHTICVENQFTSGVNLICKIGMRDDLSIFGFERSCIYGIARDNALMLHGIWHAR